MSVKFKFTHRCYFGICFTESPKGVPSEENSEGWTTSSSVLIEMKKANNEEVTRYTREAGWEVDMHYDRPEKTLTFSSQGNS